MNLKQLEYFVRVAELGSFTRASIVLDVAQPALSRQVRQLEVELRQNLLVRNGRGVTVSEAGQLLLEHSRGILHQVARAREELEQVRGSLRGRVALGLPPSLAKALTVPLTRAFQQRLPQATLCIREGLSVNMQESLSSGRLDIALLYGAVASPDIDSTRLLDEALFLVRRAHEPEERVRRAHEPEERVRRAHAPGSRAHAPGSGSRPVPLAEVAATPLVIPSRPNAIRMLVESTLAEAGLRPRIALEIDGVGALLDLVADGAGAAILSSNAVAASNHGLALRADPIAPSLRCPLWLAVSALRPATPTQQSMVRLVTELVAARISAA